MIRRGSLLRQMLNRRILGMAFLAVLMVLLARLVVFRMWGVKFSKTRDDILQYVVVFSLIFGLGLLNSALAAWTSARRMKSDDGQGASKSTGQ